MTEPQFKRTRFADVMNYESFVILDKKVQETQSFPDYAKIKTVDFFNSKKTNLLTTICVYWIKAIGGFASRQNTTGTPIKNWDDSVTWLPAAGMVGSGDIYAMYKGRTIWIEIKYGRDTQSEKQKKFEKQVTEQGATYLIVKRFEDLLENLQL